MAFDRPAPDLQKLIAAWEQFEAGEETPGRVLANLKTAGLARCCGSSWRAAGARARRPLTEPVQRAGGRQYIPRPAVWAPGGLAAPAAHPFT